MPHTPSTNIPQVGDPCATSLQKQQRASLKVHHRISKSRFPVFLVEDVASETKYAMKVFELQDGELNSSYVNEQRFQDLDHPNVVNIASALDEKTATNKGDNFSVSYILFDLAPYGDFFDLNKKIKNDTNEKIARTFFHQLIEGIEYLHSRGIAHLDLKLQNLLLGEDYELKITDFDMSYRKGDGVVKSQGSEGYRPLELLDKSLKNPFPVDIFSAGILLFNFVFGYMPYRENQPINGKDLFKMMFEDTDAFWNAHQMMNHHKPISEDFIELFEGMTQKDPRKRFGIQKIKESAWYQGETLSCREMTEFLDLHITASH